MRKVFGLIAVAMAGGLLAGCSKEEPAETAVKGKMPEVKQATPDMKSPEERARMQGGGGEGS